MVKHALRLAVALALLGLGGAVSAAPPAPAIPPATAEFRAAEGDQWIAFTGLADHQIIIPVEINGVAAHALVDTGSAETALDRGWGAAHGIVPVEIGLLRGTNGLTAHQWMGAVSSLHIGGFHQTGGGISIVDLAQVSASNKFDLLLGMDILKSFATEIDFDHALIRFRLSGAHQRTGAHAPVFFAEDEPRLLTSITFGQKTFANIMIDTGDDGDLSLLKSRFGPYPPGLRISDDREQGLGGAFTVDFTHLSDVHWGDVTFPVKVPTRFEDNPSTLGDDGRIGLELLENYNIFLDPTRGILVLIEREHPPAPPPVMNVGISMNQIGKDFVVDHVMK